MFDIDALNKFYNEVCNISGMAIIDFQNRLKTLLEQGPPNEYLNDFRLGKNPWKKLKDEILPVSRFIKFKNIETGRIYFPLDNHTPDCWLLSDNGNKFGIEVTIERGREQYSLKKEMIDKGIGRGFIGIQDDASKSDFDSRMSNPRIMYTTDQALGAVKKGVLRCLSRKNDPKKYKGVFYLLIHSDLSILKKKCYSNIREELTKEAKKLPFQEVCVIGGFTSKPWGFQIK